MSFVSYGPITFNVLKTNEFSTRPVFTEDGVDYLYTHCTLDVDAVLNPLAMAYDFGDPPAATPGTYPAVTAAAIRHALMQPRLLLIYASTDEAGDPAVILQAPQNNSLIDVNLGPKPLGCTVKEVHGIKTFAINFRVECWVHECPEGEENPPPLLSNRWSQSSSINRQNLATKVTQGIAHFRADVLANADETADTFRNQLLPVVSPGFQRTNVDIKLAASANKIMYTCVDEEQMTDLGETDARAGGSGIVRLEGSFGVASIPTKEGIAGGTTMAQIDIKAWGNKYSSNWQMIQRCLEIALTKITIGGPAIGFIRQAAIRESLTDRYVEVMIGFQQTAPGDAKVGALRYDGLRKDAIFPDVEGVNPGIPNDKGTRGSAQEKLLVQVLRDACRPVSPPFSNPESPGDGSTSDYEGPPPAVQLQSYDVLPDEPAPYTPETQEFPYTSGKMDILYHRDEGLLAAPIASTAGGSSQQGTGDQSDVPPVALFRLHPPIGYKVIEWTNERVGAMPIIPDPTTSGTNLTLIESSLTVATPEYVDDASTHVYRISGRYKYVFAAQTFGPGDPLDLGSIPWTTDPPGSNAINQEDYVGGIVDPDDTPGQGQDTGS